MPRKPRLHVIGGIYHVILRGNARQAIFFDPDDRRRWESLIATGVERYGHRVHAYCWMTNHVHLVVQCPDDPLGHFIRFVAAGYARSTNRKHGRSGHLFERRHRAILVEADSYLLQLVRYVHENPLRAGLVDELSQYRWSSHSAYAGGPVPGWLTVTRVLGMFGTGTGQARRQYARFMALPEPMPQMRVLADGGSEDHRILGSSAFVRSVSPVAPRANPAERLEQLAADVCREYSVPLAALRSRSRDRRLARIRVELSARALSSRMATNAEIARFLNRSPSAISQAVSRWRREQWGGSETE